MDTQKVDLFLAINAKNFPAHLVPQIREQLLSLDDNKAGLVLTQEFKDPLIVFIVSLISSALGIDRFLIGDTGMGVGKLLTAGGCGIWAIVDWFLIMDATREKNYQKLQEAIKYF